MLASPPLLTRFTLLANVLFFLLTKLTLLAKVLFSLLIKLTLLAKVLFSLLTRLTLLKVLFFLLTLLSRYFGIGVLGSSLFVVGGFAGREGGFLNSVEKEVEEGEEERGHWVPASFNLLTPRCGQYRCKASVTIEVVLVYLFQSSERSSLYYQMQLYIPNFLLFTFAL